MKVILEQPLSGAKSYTKGDSIDVSEAEAARMIDKGIAKLPTKKEHDAFVEKVEKANQKKLEDEAAAKALLEKDRIEAELNDLYGQVVLKEAELNGVVLTDEQVVEMVEELRKRILPGDKS